MAPCYRKQCKNIGEFIHNSKKYCQDHYIITDECTKKTMIEEGEILPGNGDRSKHMLKPIQSMDDLHRYLYSDINADCWSVCVKDSETNHVISTCFHLDSAFLPKSPKHSRDLIKREKLTKNLELLIGYLK